jgi:hypothetical protein
MDASTANGVKSDLELSAPSSANGVKTALELDDELEKMLADTFDDQAGQAVVATGDCTVRYHEMIRRAMVDWGDEIIDRLAEKFSDTPKLAIAIEEVRKELVDPLRNSLVDPLRNPLL